MTAGYNITPGNNTLKWGSYAGITFNFKSAHLGGIRGGVICRNTISECACGIYIVNQGRANDTTANSNNLRISDNHIFDIDSCNYYDNHDTHSIGVQGGVGTVIERNLIIGTGGSRVLACTKGRDSS